MTFCKYCGKQLADGEVCTCPGAAAEAASYQAAPAPGAAYYAAPAAPKAPGAFGNMMKDIWNLFLNLFKKPVTAAADFIRNSNKNHAFIMIGIQAIFVTLLLICLACKYNDAQAKLANIDQMKLYSSPEQIMQAMDNLKKSQMNIFLVILVGLISTPIVTVLFSSITMLFVKLFKGNTNFETMLKTYSVAGFIAVPFIIVGTLLLLIISGKGSSITYEGLFDFTSAAAIRFKWGMLVAVIGYLFGGLIVLGTLPETTGLDRDKQLYTVLCTFVTMFIVYWLFTKFITYPICEPEAIKVAREKAEQLEALTSSMPTSGSVDMNSIMNMASQYMGQ